MRFLSTLVFVFIYTVVFAQKNNFNPNAFTSPFKSKVDTGSAPSVVKPPANNALRTVAKKSPILQKDETFFVKVDPSYFAHLRVTAGDDIAIAYLRNQFSLDEDYSFEKANEKVDDLGYSHTNYKQLYKGVLLNESMILVHTFNGEVKSINGHIVSDISLDVMPTLTETSAIEYAKHELKVTELLQEYPVELVITKLQAEYYLAYKVRIDANNPLRMFNVFVDAKTGSILNKISLIAHADQIGTAGTYYSGKQFVTTDSFAGGYRLRDNGRKIETYDATNATLGETEIFENYTDFVNEDNFWKGIPYIATFTISKTDPSWWYSSFTDTKPDFYLVLRDGSNKVIYRTEVKKDTDTPVTFRLNQYLTNPPYKIELWDYDFGNSDDFGGSYTISTSSGPRAWSGNGNNGTYTIDAIGNPALDVHWGMQKTYDFYLDVLGRKSYDGKGAVIKNFVNPPTMQTKNNHSPNNAGAYGSPYNIMIYGLGDGSQRGPFVGLDVEGHEFTHLVVGHNGTGGLEYQGESGALDESFADIMGTAIEFYSGVDPDWTIGEGIVLEYPYFMRSMANPKLTGDPDTFKGDYWVNTYDLKDDHGGVHTNSGVQNYWFYLLSEGGSGKNDLGSSYSVSSIGMTDAVKIAYRNLTTYLTPYATYYDAYQGSLQAAEDLFGNPSKQYTAVREAWYAVGVGNDPYNYCSGITELTETSGTFSDGSGSADYNNNANCKWVIAPPGATRIQLSFSSFDTEFEYDEVLVYDGPDETYPLLLNWYGSSLPPVTQSSKGIGAMCIVFKTDQSSTAAGWSASYISEGIAPTCSDGTHLIAPTGSFDDGSGKSNYTNNQLCYWTIAPPCAKSVTLNFTAFDTEKDYDGVVVLDGFEETANIIAVLSGNSIPRAVKSTTGEMLVVFYSDHAVGRNGFEASYTSTGSAQCSGITTLNASDFGFIEDGSGAENYCNNLDCNWLIQPPQATSITLEFIDFELEESPSDGKTIFDYVKVYDGKDVNAKLLGQFTGNILPKAITSSGGSMLIEFHSDMAGNYPGWKAFYTSTSASYCDETTIMTSPSGNINDGSLANEYANNTYCSWLIQPANALSIMLSFDAFSTEKDYDGVVVYDGPDNSATVLGEFSGNTVPPSVRSTTGAMFVEFLTDPAIRAGGFSASYTSIVTGVEAIAISDFLKVYPNPSNGIINFDNIAQQSITVEILDIQGKQVFGKTQMSQGITELNLESLPKGIYTLKVEGIDQMNTTKIVIK